jgi:hypothetical protein
MDKDIAWEKREGNHFFPVLPLSEPFNGWEKSFNTFSSEPFKDLDLVP